MERCIWIIQQEDEFFVCQGYAGGVATILSGFYDVRAAKATAARLALQANPTAVHATVAPPSGVRDYPRGPVYRPDRVLADGWSWIEANE